jgi:hypothetical protein
MVIVSILLNGVGLSFAPVWNKFCKCYFYYKTFLLTDLRRIDELELAHVLLFRYGLSEIYTLSGATRKGALTY